MARDDWAYREVAVMSVPDGRGGLRIAPMPGQAFASAMRVQCARSMRDPSVYPAGTCFLVRAKVTDRQGGEPYLYCWHGDPVVVLGQDDAARFLGMYRRLRV